MLYKGTKFNTCPSSSLYVNADSVISLWKESYLAEINVILIKFSWDKALWYDGNRGNQWKEDEVSLGVEVTWSCLGLTSTFNGFSLFFLTPLCASLTLIALSHCNDMTPGLPLALGYLCCLHTFRKKKPWPSYASTSQYPGGSQGNETSSPSSFFSKSRVLSSLLVHHIIMFFFHL